MKFLRTPFSQNTFGRLLLAPLRSSYCRDFLVLHNYFERLYELGRIFGMKKVSIKDVSQELLCNFLKLLSHPSENVSILFSASFVRPFKRRRILKNFCSETLQGINKNTPMTKTFCSKKMVFKIWRNVSKLLFRATANRLLPFLLKSVVRVTIFVQITLQLSLPRNCILPASIRMIFVCSLAQCSFLPC